MSVHHELAKLESEAGALGPHEDVKKLRQRMIETMTEIERVQTFDESAVRSIARAEEILEEYPKTDLQGKYQLYVELYDLHQALHRLQSEAGRFSRGDAEAKDVNDNAGAFELRERIGEVLQRISTIQPPANGEGAPPTPRGGEPPTPERVQELHHAAKALYMESLNALEEARSGFFNPQQPISENVLNAHLRQADNNIKALEQLRGEYAPPSTLQRTDIAALIQNIDEHLDTLRKTKRDLERDVSAKITRRDQGNASWAHR